MKKLLAALALTAFMSGAAFANSCPTHVAKIDAALAANPAVSAEVQAQAKALRDEGQALHDAGKHAESMAKLAEAEKLLGIAQ
jgi:outer membrane lipoprotein-sorting protein